MAIRLVDGKPFTGHLHEPSPAMLYGLSENQHEVEAPPSDPGKLPECSR